MPDKKLTDSEIVKAVEDLNVRLTEERNRTDYIGKSYNEIKSEAYKEFAERLKESTDIDNKWCGKVVLETHIDNLLKELVGDDNSTNIDKQN